jgi:hypothetical protein
MKITVKILIVFLISLQTNAQWYPVNSNSTENLKDIFFTDSLNGYCCGGGDDISGFGSPQDNGVIIETDDGGDNWTVLFTMDSLSINNIFIVTEGQNQKLIAFANKNGASCMIYTTIDTPTQNWILEFISYTPIEPQLYDNVIYFRDGIDLKKLENNTISLITSDVFIFNINQNGLIFTNYNVDTIFYSQDFGNTNIPFPSQQSYIGQNQMMDALIFNSNDTILIYYTYPSGFVYSFDYGMSWSYNNIDYLVMGEINNTNIIGWKNDKVIRSDCFDSYTDTLQNLGFTPKKILFQNDSISFIVGENGEMYKTTNGGGITGINETENLKEKIKIYPNPAKGLLNLTLVGNLKITNIVLYDISGKLVKTYSATERELSIKGLSSGQYLLKLNSEKGIITKKVIVE